MTSPDALRSVAVCRQRQPVTSKRVCSIYVAFTFVGYIFNLPRLLFARVRSQGGFLDWGTVPEDIFIITQISDVYDGH
ncbi:hypothetical protein [Nostoc sp.]|uniref:hypothetical protein n=1 Tax=Nostoc sp. TaxID=1180 RepID=UPI002FF8FA7A